MNYKRIITNRSTRLAILNMLGWIPDSVMLRLQYYIHLGRWPDLKHPMRYTEKLQVYKMKYRNPLMQQCVDKYEVRTFVEKKGMGRILNELYGVYDSPDEIDFDSLPDRFVVKSTSGGGGNNVCVVRDKATCDLVALRNTIAGWLRDQTGQINAGREWAYTGIRKTRIIVEKYLEDTKDKGCLSDYKLMFFNGQFRVLWVDRDRYTDHHRGFWDEKLRFLPDVYSDHDTFLTAPELPVCMQEMITIGRVLAEDFPYARVDFYDVDGSPVFGEITFYPWSGYVTFHPDSFDLQLGSYFEI